MASYVASRGFALATLAWVVAGAVLITLLPNLGGWFFLLALLPFVLRLLAGRFPFPPTPFDFFFIVFIFTAGVGVWAAYDPAAAWAKFWVLVSAVLVFYALALQPQENLKRITLGLCVLSAAVTLHFLLAFNFESQPSDFGFIRRIGEMWLAVRPELGLAPVNVNVVGGVLAMLLPFHLAAVLRAWRTRAWGELGWALITGAIAALGLLLTSSRAAWLALAAGIAVWGVWVACVRIAPRLGRRAEPAFGTTLLLMGLLALAGALAFPGGLLGLANRLPGLQSGYSRVALWGEAVTLSGDYALTGGGLDAFAGHYARYELVIPYKLFEYAHNLPLDVLFEQGVFGALALAVIVFGSVWRLVLSETPAEMHAVRGAFLAAFVALWLHSLVDDALYSGVSTPWLFLLPGLLTLLSPPAASRRQWFTVQAAGVAAIALLGLAFALIPTLRAVALANLGAVEMARRELAGWPERNWQDNQDAREFTQAQARFEQALTVDPHNRTAAYRLGLIELMRDKVATAVGYLETARGAGDAPRGLTKTLGYGYVWLGRLDEAAPLLRRVPEARYELQLYAQWWPTQGQNDRAEYAAQMDRRLEALGVPVLTGPLAINP